MTAKEKNILRERGIAFLERCRAIITERKCDLTEARKEATRELQALVEEHAEQVASYPCNS